MFNLRATLIVALFLISAVTRAVAQDVTLTSRDGAVEISGDLLGYDGEFFRVETEFGVLTLDGTGVNCSGPGCPDLGAYVARLRVAGAASLGETLLPRLIEGFAAAQGYRPLRRITDDRNFTYVLLNFRGDRSIAEFSFTLSTSEAGFEALIAGDADAVLSTAEVPESVAARSLEAGLGDLTQPGRSKLIALDGLVQVVAPDNPVSAVGLTSLSKVLAGEVRNWADLGGFDAPIAMHLPEAGSAVMPMLAPFKAQPQGATLHPNSAVLTDAVARDSFALGLTRLSDTGSARTLPLAGDCGFDFFASRAAIKAEDYPLTRPQFMYLPARRLPKTMRDFLRYLGSDAAQQIVRQAGYVDQMVEEIPLSDQGDRLANAISRAGEEVSLQDLQVMIETLRGARRLTLSFRFEPGSSDLDAQSRANVLRLAEMLETGGYAGQELMFVGFSDGDGAADTNRQIALRRALAVLDAVKGAAETLDPGTLDLTARGFGEAMPLACDESEWGSRANRRVELWLKPGRADQR